MLSVPVAEQDRALITVVAHTTSPYGSRFEVASITRFLRAGVFDAQNLVTIPRAKLLRKLGVLSPTQLAADENVASCLNRLSNFAFPCQRVNFRFTYHCNIACSHCYNSSGPHATQQHLDLGAMLHSIAHMPEAGMHALNLTGGEPFLYPEELLTLIAAGRTAGLREISIYTNGFWARTPAHATRMLSRLKEAGFMACARDHLKVSAGVYHQAFIAFDRVLTLARAYYEICRRPLLLDFEMAAGQPAMAEEIRRTIAAAGLTECIVPAFRHVQPLGRGRALQVHALGPIDGPCRVIDQIVFDPDGSVRPCCGFNSENDGVKIGRMGRHSLRQLVKRMQNDPLLQCLATHAMRAIFPLVGKVQNRAGYAGACDLCQHALGDLSDGAWRPSVPQPEPALSSDAQLFASRSSVLTVLPGAHYNTNGAALAWYTPAPFGLGYLGGSYGVDLFHGHRPGARRSRWLLHQSGSGVAAGCCLASPLSRHRVLALMRHHN